MLKLAVAAVALSLPALGADGNTVGGVLNVRGVWRVDGQSAPIEPGQGIAAGVTIRADPNAGKGFIKIVLSNKANLDASCKEVPCAATLKAPASLINESPSFQKILDMVLLVLIDRHSENGNPYAPGSIREQRGSQKELVVRFDDSREISLAAFFSSLPEGSYHLELKSVHQKAKPVLSEVNWMPQQPVATVPMQPAGIYNVSVADRFGAQRIYAQLVVVSASSFEAANKSYEQARDGVSGWDDDSQHLFLRAYLIALQKKTP